MEGLYILLGIVLISLFGMFCIFMDILISREMEYKIVSKINKKKPEESEDLYISGDFLCDDAE